MANQPGVFGKKRGILATLTLSAVFLVFLGSTASVGEPASGVTVPDGYEAILLANMPAGLRANDLTFSPWGELVVPVSSATRVPCDSFVAGISPEGYIGHFADVCLDNPVLTAFGPLSGDLLFFMEGAGLTDQLFTVPSYGTPGDVRPYAAGFSVTPDMAFGPDGNLYVADIFSGTIFKVAPDGTKSVFATGFTMDKSGYPNRFNAWIGLEFDSAGNLLASDSRRHVVYRISPTGAKVVLPPVTPFPGPMAYGPDGNLYVADVSNGNVFSVSPAGVAQLFASGLYQPIEMAFGPDGALYVLQWQAPFATFGPNRIVRIEQSAPPIIEAIVDLKPDVFNKWSFGRYVTCYVELPEGFDVGEIDPTSLAVIAVNGSPVKSSILAMGPSGIGDYDADGVPDLMVKFDRRRYASSLGVGIEEVTVSGYMNDGTEFRGNDSVRVLNNRPGL